MIWEIDDGAKPIEGLDEHGRADPAYAAALGLKPARAGMRVWATLVELATAVLLAIPAMIVLVPLTMSLVEGTFDAAVFTGARLVWSIVGVGASQLFIIVFTIVQLVLHGRKGVTLGKALFGIRSVNVRTLEAPRFWRGAVVRYLLGGAAFLVPFFGPVLVFLLSPLFDPDRRGRGWLDRAAATWFVDVRRGLNPYDVKRMRIARKELTAVYHEEQAPLPSLATSSEQGVPVAFVPTSRFSGGVLGAHRLLASETDAAPGHPDAPAPAGGALASSATPPATPAAPVAAPVIPDAPAPAPPLITGVPATAAEAPPVGAPATPTATEGVRAVLVLDTGQRIDVTATVLIGRAPSPADGEGDVQRVPVADESRSVSKTHVAIMPTRRGLLAVDRGSTNGSAIVRDATETALVPGNPVALAAGDTVRFGDRSLIVEHA